MIFRRIQVKLTAIFIIIAFIFQMELFVNAQLGDEIERQFKVARELYNRGEYESAGQRLERLIVVMSEKGLENKFILGQCYLLLGAIFERGNQLEKAGENYRSAVDIGITKVEGVDLDALALYRMIVKGERSDDNGGVITEEGKKKKGKFPWLLVAGGVVVAGLLVYFLIIKPKNKKYVLTVIRGDGVKGSPESGSYVYKKGTVVGYDFSLADKDKYRNLKVSLDGSSISSPGAESVYGTIKMNRNHSLDITAEKITFSFFVDKEIVDIDEGKTASINVQLSAWPGEEITASVTRDPSGDTDITVVEGNTLTFTKENYSKPHVVTFHAGIDADSNDDEAIFDISAKELETLKITVTAKEDAAPVISIDSPSHEDTVSGKVDIRVTAIDDKGIHKVEYYIDDIRESTDQSSPYSYNWNTTDYSNGSHVIMARAYDTIGQTAEDTVTVIVGNIKDNPPTVSIISPSNGETVRGVVTIRVDAQDDSGIINKVALYIDSDPVGSDTVQPYSFKFDTRAVPNGTHFIKAVAYDSKNQYSEVQIIVTVDNR